MGFYQTVFDPVFLPLLNLFKPAGFIIFLSFIVSLITVLIYKFATDQKKMKQLKEEQKELQKKIKGLKNEPKKMMELQKEIMKKNMEYMKHSLKAIIITFLPLILIFGWMNSYLSYQPVLPNEEFSLVSPFSGELKLPEGLSLINQTKESEKIVYQLKSSQEGNFVVFLEKKGNNSKIYSQEIEVSKNFKPVRQGGSELQVVYPKLKPAKGIPLLENLSWLWLYIIFSLIFSLGLRKILKVH